MIWAKINLIQKGNIKDIENKIRKIKSFLNQIKLKKEIKKIIKK